MRSSDEITALLKAWGEGDNGALERLVPLVHNELHRIAAMRMRGEREDHTLQTTALINEAYLKLIDQPSMTWQGRNQFFAIASSVMRRVLVDYARHKTRLKRGGKAITLQLNDDVAAETSGLSIDLLALDEVLERLKLIDERHVRIVELRFFAGLSLDDTAEALSCSRTTVATDWRMAKAWIKRELTR